ncbi:MAG: hypothetical protein CBC13_06195 [Planctomycetia bacterium TMED53]|nr:MAG: hypothetical protein CBC13_06195 [Planctomycetia bacterium TMED53]
MSPRDHRNSTESGAPSEECSIHQVSDWLAAGEPIQLVDVREEYELVEGILPGAIHIPLASIPGSAQEEIDPERLTVVYCQHGIRSLQATRYLRSQGWEKITSMSGGFADWLEASLSLESSSETENRAEDWDATRNERYLSQLRLPELGLVGQQKLLQSRVLIVGVGGLGCPVATYLAAAGVGELTIVDDDSVSLSNLPRQVLFKTADIGSSKVSLAASTLREMNPDVKVIEHGERLDEKNATELISGMNVVVDTCDNFETRFTVSDAATKLGIPVVHGAVHKFEGLVTVFDPANDAPCLRCLHPIPPSNEDCGSCAEVGVLGVLPGLVGLYQSLEVLKILTGIGAPLHGELLTIDTLSSDQRRIKLQPLEGCYCRK